MGGSRLRSPGLRPGEPGEKLQQGSGLSPFPFRWLDWWGVRAVTKLSWSCGAPGMRPSPAGWRVRGCSCPGSRLAHVAPSSLSLGSPCRMGWQGRLGSLVHALGGKGRGPLQTRPSPPACPLALRPALMQLGRRKVSAALLSGAWPWYLACMSLVRAGPRQGTS